LSQCQIVVIEDNPADVFLIRLALEENGVPCEMTLFNNGEEALRVLCPPEGGEESVFVPDAILLDLNTPRSDGFSVLARLRQTSRLAEVPIAIITSSQATTDRDRIARLGGIRYIPKPSHLDAFLSTVSKAVKEMLSGTTGGPV
jgi:CheY-like chemotaxis protein